VVSSPEGWRLRHSTVPPQASMQLLTMASPTGDTAAAITEYQAVLRAKPQYVAARMALADVYVKNHDSAAAIEQL
jgi:thioredoxin-like negative regulator of GroEL